MPPTPLPGMYGGASSNHPPAVRTDLAVHEQHVGHGDVDRHLTRPGLRVRHIDDSNTSGPP